MEKMKKGQNVLLEHHPFRIGLSSDFNCIKKGRQSQSLQSGDYPRPMDPSDASDANLDSIEVAKQFAKDIGTNKTQLELASFVQNLAPCTGDLILFLVVSNCHAWGC